jgi:hypothetical protein
MSEDKNRSFAIRVAELLGTLLVVWMLLYAFGILDLLAHLYRVAFKP